MKQLAIVAVIGFGLFAPDRVKAQVASADSTLFTPIIVPFDYPIDPETYLIRPGERLVVTPIKAGLPAFDLVVGPEGKIVDTRIGVIDVAGMTLTQVRKRLEEPLAGQFRSSQIIVSIAAPRPISISVTGAVVRPDSYLLYSSQRVSDAIARAGGIRAGGSTRLIEFSGGPRTLIADLDRIRFGRDTRANPPVYAGTSVYVPERSAQSVRVAGEVVSPRDIELISGDTRNDLIGLSGGVLLTGNVEKSYVLNDPQRASTDLIPRSGDMLVVPISEEYLNRRGVVVGGAVTRPGGYRFHSGQTLADLLNEAGGPSAGAVVNRSVIFRRGDRLEPGADTLPPVPISQLFGAGGKPLTIALRPLDSVYIPAAVGTVKITGLVRRPGLFRFDKEQTVARYISAAGGWIISSGSVDISIRNHVTGQVFLAASESIVEDGDEISVTSAERKP